MAHRFFVVGHVSLTKTVVDDGFTNSHQTSTPARRSSAAPTRLATHTKRDLVGLPHRADRLRHDAADVHDFTGNGFTVDLDVISRVELRRAFNRGHDGVSLDGDDRAGGQELNSALFGRYAQEFAN